MILGILTGDLGGPKWGQNRAKKDLYAVFCTLQYKVSSAKPGNKLKFGRWLGLSPKLIWMNWESLTSHSGAQKNSKIKAKIGF